MTRSRKTALTIFAVSLAVYLLTLSNVFNGDGLGYARIVETTDLGRLFSVPARLLFCPTGKIIHELAHLLGFPVRSVRSLQILNAIFGATGTAIFFLAAHTATKNRRLSLIATLGLGGSLAYWFWCTNATSYPGNACFLILTLFLLLRISQPHHGRSPVSSAAWIGVVHALAGFYWLTAALLFPAVATGILMAAHRSELRIRLRAAVVYALAFGACLFIPLLSAGLATGKVNGLSDFPVWLSSASYGIPPQLSLLNVSRGVIGFSSSVFRMTDLGPLVKSVVWGVPFVEQSRAGIYAELAAFAALWGMIALMTIVFALSRKRIVLEHLRTAKLLLIWIALPAIFGLVWLGSDTERWLAVLPAVWLLMTVIAANAHGRRFPMSPTWVKSLFTAFAIATVAFNAAFSAIPDRNIDNNEYLRTARFLDLRMTDDDLVLLWGHDNEFTGEHLRYFYGKRSSHIGQVLRESGEKTLDVLQSEIDETRSRQGKVFLIGRLFVDGGPGESEIESTTKDVSRAELQEFFSRGTRKVAFSLGNDSYWEIIGGR